MAQDIVLAITQRQGAGNPSASREVPATGADSVRLEVIGFSQEWLKDPRCQVKYVLEASGDGVRFDGIFEDNYIGGPDKAPRPPATEWANPTFSVELVPGAMRPRYVRAWAETDGYQTYGLALTFLNAGVPV